MRRRVFILVLALFMGVVAFALMRGHTGTARRDVLAREMPELAWMRSELGLTDAQYESVSQLHAAYLPRCEAMCRRIADARADVEARARASREMTPDLQAALRRSAMTEADCRQAMLVHLYQTAAELEPEQAQRYLEAMVSVALETSHGESPAHR
jgi:hypothetical protein